MRPTLLLQSVLFFSVAQFGANGASAQERRAVLDRDLLEDVYRQSRKVRDAYSNQVFSVQNTFELANGQPYPLKPYTIGISGDFVRVCLGAESVAEAPSDASTIHVAGPRLFFTAKKTNRGSHILGDASNRVSSKSIGSYEPLKDRSLNTPLGIFSVWGVPIWEIDAQSGHVRIVGCERMTDGVRVRLTLAMKQGEKNADGPTDAVMEIDPSLGWVVTSFKHPIVDAQMNVTAFNQCDFHYEGEFGGVAKLKVAKAHGLRTDAKTRASPNYEVWRIVEYQPIDLPPEAFTPEALGIAYGAKEGGPFDSWVLIPAIGAVGVLFIVVARWGSRRRHPPRS